MGSRTRISLTPISSMNCMSVFILRHREKMGCHLTASSVGFHIDPLFPAISQGWDGVWIRVSSLLFSYWSLMIENKRSRWAFRGADFPSYVLPATSTLPGLLDIYRKGLSRKPSFNSERPRSRGTWWAFHPQFVSTQEEHLNKKALWFWSWVPIAPLPCHLTTPLPHTH